MPGKRGDGHPRGLADAHKFVEDYETVNIIDTATCPDVLRCEEDAERAREEFKNSGCLVTYELCASTSTSSKTPGVAKEIEKKRRRINNRKSAAGTKVYADVLVLLLKKAMKEMRMEITALTAEAAAAKHQLRMAKAVADEGLRYSKSVEAVNKEREMAELLSCVDIDSDMEDGLDFGDLFSVCKESEAFVIEDDARAKQE